MAIVYEKSKALTDRELHYCPGCHHGISISSSQRPWRS